MALPSPKRSENKVWPKHPDGTWQLALADVIYLGFRVNTDEKTKKRYPQERAALIWQSMECEPGTATRFELASELTWTISDRGNLRKLLAPWLGPFPNDAAFEAVMRTLDSRIGENVLATITHNPSKTDASKVYVNVSAVGKLMKGMQPFLVAGYTRRDYWTKKIAEYAAAHAAWLAEQQQTAATEAANGERFPAAGGGLDERPAALDEPEDDLPFS